VIFIGSGLAVALGLLYPVQRSLDLARYDHPTYRYEVQGVFPVTTEPAVHEAVGGGSCLVSLWQTDLVAGSLSAGPTELDAMSPSCPDAVSRFPASALVAHRQVNGPAWIDIGADAARALKVWVGSHVSVTVGPGIEPVPLTVRDIYAVRATGSAFAAMAPADVLFGHLPADAGAGYSIVLTDTTPAQVQARLDTSPVRPQLEQAKGYPPTVVSTDQLAQTAAESSATSLGLVRTIGALSAIGVLLLGLREFDVFRRRATPAIVVIHRLGGSLMASVVGAFCVAAAVSAAAITVAVVVARAAYSLGWVASCFPPDLGPSLLGAWAVATAASAAWSVLMARLTYQAVGS
jgi:hypothetical protein